MAIEIKVFKASVEPQLAELPAYLPGVEVVLGEEDDNGFCTLEVANSDMPASAVVGALKNVPHYTVGHTKEVEAEEVEADVVAAEPKKSKSK